MLYYFKTYLLNVATAIFFRDSSRYCKVRKSKGFHLTSKDSDKNRQHGKYNSISNTSSSKINT